MALWQFSIHLIPIEWLEKTGYNLKLMSDKDTYDMSITWVNHQPTLDIFSLIDAVMPKGKSWHKDLRVWGNLESTDIQVWVENGKIESVGARIDLREDILSNLEIIVNLAKKLDCMLFILESNELLKPDLSKLLKASKNSNAEKFVSNPEDYLDGLI